jgi:hypothetical protein
MAPRSRTGKLMQGLFGRFGKKNPESSVNRATPRRNDPPFQPEYDDREPIASRYDNDDDEETNWDDAETLADDTNLWAQPVAGKVVSDRSNAIVAPPTPTAPDLEDWDEALPAATVKSSNLQEARRGKSPVSVPPTEDVWDESLPQQTFLSNNNVNLDRSAPGLKERAIGFWSGTLQQFRRFLPAPIRQLSDAILIAIAIAIVTVGIWFVDGFFIPKIEPSVAKTPSTPIAAQPYSQPAIDTTSTNPEQAFIEAIETQLSDITSQYPDDLIQTLSVDIARDRLVVRLDPIWYTLDDEQQNRLTDRMWLQAQSNQFSKLEIQDSQGVSIARSPVVGKHPIILQRRSTN